MTISMRMSVDAVKFFPTSQGKNKPKANATSRTEERTFLKGRFAGLDQHGQEDSKRVLNAWFSSEDQEEMVWQLGQAGKGVVLLGTFSEVELLGEDSSSISKRLSDARVACYNSKGEFSYTEDGVPVKTKGEAGKPVVLEVEYSVNMVHAETLTGDRNVGRRQVSMLDQLDEALEEEEQVPEEEVPAR